jgi:pimeloyl-ACP methyl ester carboxylesterase
MSAQTKPTIVFCHGIWADGSCFNKVIPALQADGYEVIAVQYGLDSFEEDLATVKRTLNRVGSPVLLVGHSYGGATITGSGTDERVVGLVYIAAVAPDAGETVQDQLDKYPSDISLASRSPMGVLGCFRAGPSSSQETSPRRTRSWFGPPIMRPSTICSSNRSSAPTKSPGGRSQAGTFWPRKTTLCIPTCNAGSQSAWERLSPRWRAATCRCSPSLMSLST